MASYDNMAGSEQDADSHSENSHNYTQMAQNDTGTSPVNFYAQATNSQGAGARESIGSDLSSLGATLKKLDQLRKEFPNHKFSIGGRYE